MLSQYYPIQQALVGDIFVQILSLMLVFLVTYVLYRSSQSVYKRKDKLLQQEVSLLVHIENLKTQQMLTESVFSSSQDGSRAQSNPLSFSLN